MTTYKYYQSPYGMIKIGYKNKHIVSLKKVEELGEESSHINNVLHDNVVTQLDAYFNGELKEFNLPLNIEGTEFQQRVWQELMNIPYGETRSYKEVAEAIGNYKASRAIGMANNKNPIHIIIPCHRVIGSSGKLVGYAGGMDMKKGLLEMEQRKK